MQTILIGFLGGLLTGISPCILPVLPVIFLTAGTRPAKGHILPEVIPAKKSRPYFIILGMVISFSAFTILGSAALALLGLPQDAIKWFGVAALLVLGAAFIFPSFEQVLEAPFRRLRTRNNKNGGNPLALGLTLGAVFVPCAGPVLSAIIIAGSTGSIDASIVILTVSFAIGVAIPLLVLALAGRKISEFISRYRSVENKVRIAAGVSMVVLAVAITFNVPQKLQTLIPDYTSGAQRSISESDAGRSALSLRGIETDENRGLKKCKNGSDTLASCGKAPPLSNIDHWINTPGGRPVDLDELRGRVVLVDFWAYSCINCQRSIPHVTAWDEKYRDLGLSVIGVHSPEYAFEKELRNVESGVKDFDISYPVAMDNSLSTWTAYRNSYWPAHYLIDADGVVRQISQGEGGYDETEELIRQLLSDANGDTELPGKTSVEDETPDGDKITQETFLGYSKANNYSGRGQYSPSNENFALFGRQKNNTFGLEGKWNLSSQSISPVDRGRIRINSRYEESRIVLSGRGIVTVEKDGKKESIVVDGNPRSYLIDKGGAGNSHDSYVEVPEGVDVFSFTFG